ncbi:MAG: hypothetical protein OHK0046_09680 [Anaerolineae bacterium]
MRTTWDFTDNIIARAEFRHQRYLIETSRSPSGWIALAVVMLVPALLTSVILFGVGALGLDVRPFFAPTGTWHGNLARIGGFALLTMNIALYLVVLLITLGLASNSITREHRSKNWDILLLTNVNARQLVWGKWWASLQALWGDHVIVALLRLGLVGAVIAFHENRLPPGVLGLSPELTHLISITAIMLVFTLLDAAFSTAMGVAIPLSNWSSAVVGAVVFALRAFTLFLALWFANEIRLALINDGPYLLIAIGGLVGFAGATWLALVIAQVIAVRGQVSPS